MQIACRVTIALLLAFQGHATVLGADWFAEPTDGAKTEDENEAEAATEEAAQLASQVDQEMAAKTDSQNAKESAGVAKQAAIVANKVADHSVKITTHAKEALKHALHALHEARVDSQGLNSEQTSSLKKAEDKLQDATKQADMGKTKKVEEDLKKNEMQAKLDKKKSNAELEQMKQDVEELRKKLKKKNGDAESDKELADLEQQLEDLEKANASDETSDAKVNDEMKAEIERLREQVEKYDKKPKDEKKEKELMKDVKMDELDEDKPKKSKSDATPVQEKGIDIDTSMPYGELEPFGREDTAQELTESSVLESNEMVDQLERAEVAEEKRAVFRALTRLRGAAITAFDGVARSQTGNIDEYNKIHKWRKTHPLHHLADEESDVTKWAFPDNADLIQVDKRFPDLSKWARSQ